MPTVRIPFLISPRIIILKMIWFITYFGTTQMVKDGGDGVGYGGGEDGVVVLVC